MSTLSVKASFDGTELVQGFKNVKTELSGLKSAGEQAGKSLGEMLQQKNSTTNYARQLSQIKTELTDLAVNYSKLSEADKNTEFGVTMAARIDELKAKATELKSVMDEVNTTLKGTSEASGPDVKVWDGASEMIELCASGLQTYAGAAGLSEETTEALTRTLARMAAIQAGANTVIKLGKILQKESNIMLVTAKVQNMAAAAAVRVKAAAEGKSVVATKAATVAQKAFNVVAKANPYVLLATVILGVGAALVGFVKHTKDAEKEQEEYNKQIEEQNEKERER